MALKAGTFDDLSGSMAELMEQVFRDTLPRVISDADPDRGERERRVLFVAVAQGVVGHLRDHPNSFKVEVDLPPSQELDGVVTQIVTN